MDSTSSLWNWVDQALIPGLYDVTWYNGRPFEYKEGFISNKKNFLIGMPRLRQLRSKPSKREKRNIPVNSVVSVSVIPLHQSLKMLQSCFVKCGLKFFSSEKLFKLAVVGFKYSVLKIRVSDCFT